MGEAYENTIQREQRLRDLGYTVKTIWEHDYRTLRETKEMKQFLAPPTLYHPVLPVRIRDKLFFPLCKRCVMENSSECRHSEEERSFWGIEVQKAIEKGYRVLQIHEVWHFENTSIQ